MVKLDLKNVSLEDVQIGGVNLGNVNWKQKLCSRKFWIGVALVTVGIVLCINGDTENGIRVAAIGGSVYLGMETLVDVIRLVVQGMDASDDKLLEDILTEDTAEVSEEAEHNAE